MSKSRPSASLSPRPEAHFDCRASGYGGTRPGEFDEPREGVRQKSELLALDVQRSPYGATLAEISVNVGSRTSERRTT
jgi:hypothetical protein